MRLLRKERVAQDAILRYILICRGGRRAHERVRKRVLRKLPACVTYSSMEVNR